MKNIGNLFVRLFVVSPLAFRYFSTIASLFGAGAAPFFTAPAPAPNKPFRRLRLRLRPKCVGSGGSGSASLAGWPSFVNETFILSVEIRYRMDAEFPVRIPCPDDTRYRFQHPTPKSTPIGGAGRCPPNVGLSAPRPPMMG